VLLFSAAPLPVITDLWIRNNMKKILIVNDDGIDSPGLIRLAACAKNFGEVWVTAPDGQRSAVSHSISIREPIDVYEREFPVEGVHAFAVSGTPADCTRIGILKLVPGRPDAVLSGINFGHNAGADIQYSATCGAAFEAAQYGINAIALSEGAGELHEVTDEYLPGILAGLLDIPGEQGKIWNVNFPMCTLDECRGILRERRLSPTGFYDDDFSAEPLPDGGTRYRVIGSFNDKAPEGTDLNAIVGNYISIGRLSNIS